MRGWEGRCGERGKEGRQHKILKCWKLRLSVFSTDPMPKESKSQIRQATIFSRHKVPKHSDMARAPRKRCDSCLNAFPPHKIAQHQQTRTTKKCQACRINCLKTEKHVCTHTKCHKCRMTFEKARGHICSNSFVHCNKCTNYISCNDFETHDCKMKHCWNI